MSKRLEGKVALITGGTGGIGKETMKLFLKEGAKVAVVGRNEDKLKEIKDEFKDVLTVRADVSKEEEVKNYVDKTVKEFGKIDIFFNNAGMEGQVAPLVEQTVEDFKQVLDVNVIGVFLGLKHVIPVMKEHGSGSIINTSSVAGLGGQPNLSPYIASKHAVVGLTKAAAVEYSSDQIRVNSIHPAPVDTQMMESIEGMMDSDDPSSAREQFEAAVPLGRYAESIDIANVVLFLGSDDSSYVTGAQYTIDGGMLAGT